MSNSSSKIKSLYSTSAKKREKNKENWKEEKIVYYTFYGSEPQKAITNTAALLGNF